MGKRGLDLESCVDMEKLGIEGNAVDVLPFYHLDAGPRGESPSVLAGQLEPGQLETQKLGSLTVPGLCVLIER